MTGHKNIYTIFGKYGTVLKKLDLALNTSCTPSLNLCTPPQSTTYRTSLASLRLRYDEKWQSLAPSPQYSLRATPAC